MTQQKLQILDSFAFTLESIKYAEAERNYQLNRTGLTTATTGARGTGTVTHSSSPKTNCIDRKNNAEIATPTPLPPPTIATATPIPTEPPQTTNNNASAPNTTTTATAAAIESSFETLSQQIAKARLQIQQSLKDHNISLAINSSSSASSGGVKVDPVEEEAMRVENELLKKKVELLEGQVKQLTDRVTKLELGGGAVTGAKVVPPPAKASGDSKKDDDDVDLFGSDEEEDEEAARIKEARLAEYAAKKSKKAAVIAKSNVILDIKPWDDETDMKELEKSVRTIVMDGLLWGSSKLVEIAYGVKKLQIATVIEDDKVSVEELQEKIEAFEDFVQSVDIAAFNKI